MKKQILLIIGLIAVNFVLAQVPQGISHQAVIRNADNELVVNSQIGIQVSILQGGAAGQAVYVETHTPISNANGLITYIIGAGTVESGTFAEIDWSAGPYFLKTEADPTGGTDYSITGVMQFLSVPYAMHSETAKVAESFITKPPKAISTEATDIGAGVATLNGIVNGEGFITAVVFEWGTSTDYGNTAPAVQSHVTGSDDVAVHAGLTGLQATTTYHFRIRATNAVDVVYSEDMIFITDDSAVAYSLNLDVQPEGAGGVSGAGEYHSGVAVSITATAYEGWEFVNWTGGIEHIDDPNSASATLTMPAENVGITANFQEIETGLTLLTITVSCNLNQNPIEDARVDINFDEPGFYFFSGQTDENGQVILTEVPPGWHELYVTKAGYSSYWDDFIMGDENKNIDVLLVPLYYELSLSPNPIQGGSVEGSGSYLMGEVVNISASEAENWEFTSWSGDIQYLDGDINSSTNSVTMPNLDISITARFVSTILPTVEINMINNSQPGLTITEAAVLIDSGTDDSVRGFVWSTEENPDLDHNEGFSDDHGTGLGDFLIELSDLTPNTMYYIRAYATNSAGTAYSDQHSFIFWDYHNTVSDIDDNVYQTIIIGNKEWMAENLRVTKSAAGTNIIRYCYANNPINCELYGGLYTWSTAMNGQSSSSNNPSGVQGICPIGWHLPSDEEWSELLNYLNLHGYPNSNATYGAGNALKSCRQDGSPLGGDCDTSEHPHWSSHSTHYGFDEFGFSALPGGYQNSGGSSLNLGNGGYWWSATEWGSIAAWSRNVLNSNGDMTRSSFNRLNRSSIRCLREVTDGQTLYNLHLEINPENTGIVIGAGQYQEGAVVNITAIPKEGWAFESWSGNNDYIADQTSANTTVTMPAQNISLTANFDKEESVIVYGDGVTDIDGNDYITVIINNREWMAQNLRVTRYNNEDEITTGLTGNQWSSNTSGAYAVYPHADIDGLNSDEEVLEAYGALYNWHAVSTGNLCPIGWSVPGDDDWTQLANYIVSQGYPNSNVANGAGNVLKSCRQVNSNQGSQCITSEHPRWDSDNTHIGFDKFGFSSLPGGYRFIGGSFGNIGNRGFWWTSTEQSSSSARYQYIYHDNGQLRSWSQDKRNGNSIRCIRDIVRTEDD